MEDKELIRGCAEGDEKCFKEIFNRYKDKVFSISFSILKNSDEAEDVVQNTFIKAFNNINNLRKFSSLTSWILRIAYHTALDIRKGKHADMSLDEMMENRNRHLRSKTGGVSPDLNVLAKEMENTITEAVENLPDPLKQAFILGVIEKLPYKQVSQILNISETSVKMNIYRARKALKEELVDYLN